MKQSVRSLLKEKGTDVWSIHPSATVFEAIEEMSARSVGALVVLDNTNLVGIVSERDYTRKVILKQRSSKETQVLEIMSSDVKSVSPDRTAEECLAVMTKYRIRHLPIQEDRKVIGVISIGDIVRAILTARGQLIDQLERYIVGH